MIYFEFCYYSTISTISTANQSTLQKKKKKKARRDDERRRDENQIINSSSSSSSSISEESTLGLKYNLGWKMVER